METLTNRKRGAAETRRALFASPMLFVCREAAGFAFCTVDYVVPRNLAVASGAVTVQERDRILAAAAAASTPAAWAPRPAPQTVAQAPQRTAAVTVGASGTREDEDCNPASPQTSAPRSHAATPNGAVRKPEAPQPAPAATAEEKTVQAKAAEAKATEAETAEPKSTESKAFEVEAAEPKAEPASAPAAATPSVPPAARTTPPATSAAPTSPPTSPRSRKHPRTSAPIGPSPSKAARADGGGKLQSIPLRLRRGPPSGVMEVSPAASTMLALAMPTRSCVTCSKMHSGTYGCGDYCSASCSKMAGAVKRWGRRSGGAGRKTAKRARVPDKSTPTQTPSTSTPESEVAEKRSPERMAVCAPKTAPVPGTTDGEPNVKRTPGWKEEAAVVRPSPGATASVQPTRQLPEARPDKKATPDPTTQPAISGAVPAPGSTLQPTNTTNDGAGAAAVDVHATPSPRWDGGEPVEHGLIGEHLLYLAEDVGAWRRGTITGYAPTHERHLIAHVDRAVPDAWLFLRYCELRFVDVLPP